MVRLQQAVLLAQVLVVGELRLLRLALLGLGLCHHARLLLHGGTVGLDGRGGDADELAV
eukprot:CAMPEP_0176108366 /NCGR_PEP_ID=MMETSP0120_2-20121206/54399_1 /TAXON_ID=160619 /ORGANISM="Kryptoperidinium foliaceum, Strain CCMP 1326" /LENGTH=58 /DNA_ID=CAMNT_0017442531 /DNA_START=30 /DNA_END=202 /DNA_ORIENTATION=+